MPNGSEPPLIPDRLDSWKAIAAYLRRDERTVRRWEKTLGLPVRRVPGGRGASVFAYVSEIEAWLQRTPTARESAEAPASSASLVETPGDPARATNGRVPRRWWVGLAGAVTLGAVLWRVLPATNASGLDLQLSSATIVAVDRSGAERWRHDFPAEERALFPSETPWAVPETGRSAVYVLLGNRQRRSDDANLGGELREFSAGGRPGPVFAMDEPISFGEGRYGAPWALLSFRIHDGDAGRRIAVVGHHYVAWPGAVTVLDEHLARRGMFVNAGWLESVRWLSADRLIVVGYSSARKGGVVALLDANAMNGQSPEPPDSPFHCESCGPDAPVRYVVLPPSELNLVSGSGLNRARLEVSADHLLVRTEEVVEADRPIVDAVYEFSPALELLKASYSERYWDLHKSLELQGRIRHSREQCPDRDGPREIQVWDPAGGWKTTRLHSPAR